MKPRIRECEVVLHQHDPQKGLTETRVRVASLEELYALCLDSSKHTLIDHLVLRGDDENGASQSIAFGFHAMTKS
jgi:hypothetical protein